MCSPALGSVERAFGDTKRHAQHFGNAIGIFELGVGMLALVFDADFERANVEFFELFNGFREVLTNAENADIVVHNLFHRILNHIHIFATCRVDDAVDVVDLLFEELLDKLGFDFGLSRCA